MLVLASFVILGILILLPILAFLWFFIGYIIKGTKEK